MNENHLDDSVLNTMNQAPQDAGSPLGKNLLLAELFSVPEPLRIPLAEAVQRVGAPTDLESLQKVVAAGVLSLEADEDGTPIVVLPNPVVLQAGELLHSIGVGPMERIEEFVAMREDIRRIVDRFVALIDRHVDISEEMVAEITAGEEAEEVERFLSLVKIAQQLLESTFLEEVRIHAESRLQPADATDSLHR